MRCPPDLLSSYTGPRQHRYRILSKIQCQGGSSRRNEDSAQIRGREKDVGGGKRDTSVAYFQFSFKFNTRVDDGMEEAPDVTRPHPICTSSQVKSLRTGSKR